MAQSKVKANLAGVPPIFSAPDRSLRVMDYGSTKNEILPITPLTMSAIQSSAIQSFLSAAAKAQQNPSDEVRLLTQKYQQNPAAFVRDENLLGRTREVALSLVDHNQLGEKARQALTFLDSLNGRVIENRWQQAVHRWAPITVATLPGEVPNFGITDDDQTLKVLNEWLSDQGIFMATEDGKKLDQAVLVLTQGLTTNMELPVSLENLARYQKLIQKQVRKGEVGLELDPEEYHFFYQTSETLDAWLEKQGPLLERHRNLVIEELRKNFENLTIQGMPEPDEEWDKEKFDQYDFGKTFVQYQMLANLVRSIPAQFAEKRLEVALDLLVTLSPDLAGPFVDRARELGIGIHIDPDMGPGNSYTAFSPSSFHSDKPQGLAIFLNSQASLSEIFHELVHAVLFDVNPEKLPEVFRELVNHFPKLNVNAPMNQLITDLQHRQAYMEPPAFAAQALLAKDLRDRGIPHLYDSPSYRYPAKDHPGLDAVFFEKGLEGLAHEIPHRVGPYHTGNLKDTWKTALLIKTHSAKREFRYQATSEGGQLLIMEKGEWVPLTIHKGIEKLGKMDPGAALEVMKRLRQDSQEIWYSSARMPPYTVALTPPNLPENPIGPITSTRQAPSEALSLVGRLVELQEGFPSQDEVRFETLVQLAEMTKGPRQRAFYQEAQARLQERMEALDYVMAYPQGMLLGASLIRAGYEEEGRTYLVPALRAWLRIEGLDASQFDPKEFGDHVGDLFAVNLDHLIAIWQRIATPETMVFIIPELLSFTQFFFRDLYAEASKITEHEQRPFDLGADSLEPDNKMDETTQARWDQQEKTMDHQAQEIFVLWEYLWRISKGSLPNQEILLDQLLDIALYSSVAEGLREDANEEIWLRAMGRYSMTRVRDPKEWFQRVDDEHDSLEKKGLPAVNFSRHYNDGLLRLLEFSRGLRESAQPNLTPEMMARTAAILDQALEVFRAPADQTGEDSEKEYLYAPSALGIRKFKSVLDLMKPGLVNELVAASFENKNINAWVYEEARIYNHVIQTLLSRPEPELQKRAWDFLALMPNYKGGGDFFDKTDLPSPSPLSRLLQSQTGNVGFSHPNWEHAQALIAWVRKQASSPIAGFSQSPSELQALLTKAGKLLGPIGDRIRLQDIPAREWRNQILRDLALAWMEAGSVKKARAVYQRLKIEEAELSHATSRHKKTFLEFLKTPEGKKWEKDDFLEWVRSEDSKDRRVAGDELRLEAAGSKSLEDFQRLYEEVERDVHLGKHVFSVEDVITVFEWANVLTKDLALDFLRLAIRLTAKSRGRQERAVAQTIEDRTKSGINRRVLIEADPTLIYHVPMLGEMIRLHQEGNLFVDRTTTSAFVHATLTLFKTIDQAKLDTHTKETLMIEAIHQIFPLKPEEWLEMWQTLPEILTAIHTIVDHRYPKAEKEFLSRILTLSEALRYEEKNKALAWAGLVGLRTIVEELAKRYPEMTFPENFSSHMGRARSIRERQLMAQVDPITAAIALEKDMSSLGKILRGVISPEDAAIQLRDWLNRSPFLTLSDADQVKVLELVQGIVDQDFKEVPDEVTPAVYWNRPVMRVLASLLNGDTRLNRAILGASTALQATKKRALYDDLIFSPNPDPGLQTLAMEMMAFAGVLSQYVYNFYIGRVLGEEDQNSFIKNLQTLRAYQNRFRETPSDAFLTQVFSSGKADTLWKRLTHITEAGENYKMDFDEVGDAELLYDLWSVDSKPSWEDYITGIRSFVFRMEPVPRHLRSHQEFFKSRFSVGSIHDVFIYPRKKEEFLRRLNELKEDRIGREQEIIGTRYQLPRSFAKLHPLFQFAAAKYFMKLELGKRKDILDSLATRDMNEAELVEQFFVMTGTEYLGQIASYRPGLMPEALRARMERFQDDIPKSNPRMVGEALSAHGADYRALFQDLDYEHGKSGKVGEVYEATLAPSTPYVLKDKTHTVGPEGLQVKIKILTQERRDNLEMILTRTRSVAEDMDAGAHRLGLRFNATRMQEEMAAGLREEMDYRNEIRNGYALQEILPNGISITGFIPNLSRKNILVMLPAVGVRFLDLNPAQRLEAANRLAQGIAKNLVSDRRFHEDPHPGNVFVTPETGEITLIDHGREAKLTENEAAHLEGFLQEAMEGNLQKMIEEIVHHLSELKHGIRDSQGLEKDLMALIQATDLGQLRNVMLFFNDVFSIAFRNGYYIRYPFIAVHFMLMKFEGAMKANVNPEFSMVPYLLMAMMKKRAGLPYQEHPRELFVPNAPSPVPGPDPVGAGSPRPDVGARHAVPLQGRTQGSPLQSTDGPVEDKDDDLPKPKASGDLLVQGLRQMTVGDSEIKAQPQHLQSGWSYSLDGSAALKPRPPKLKQTPLQSSGILRMIPKKNEPKLAHGGSPSLGEHSLPLQGRTPCQRQAQQGSPQQASGVTRPVRNLLTRPPHRAFRFLTR